MSSVWVVILLAANKGWPLFQFNVKGVFLHGDLEANVHMTPLPRFWLPIVKGKVCKLKKSLYG